MNETTRSWSERERKRETHAHNQQRDPDWEKAREEEEEPWRKCMLYQSVTTIPRPNSQSVKIELDITRICAGRWGLPQSCGSERKRGREGGGGGENKRVKGPVREQERERASKRKGERETEKKIEIETHHGTQEREWERKKERATTTETASEENWDQNAIDRVREKEKGTEGTMWHVLHTAVPSGTQLPHASPYPFTFKTITLVHLSGNEILSG